jgi:hypothetical protein
LAVLSSFGFDALRAVLRARAPPLRHHRRPIDAPVVHRGLGNIELAGWDAQTWNNSARPGVVACVWPSGSVKIAVPSGNCFSLQPQNVFMR